MSGTTTCTRKPGSFTTMCRCPECRAHTARRRKQYKAGIVPPNRSDDAWRVIDRLIELGWTPSAIASATHVAHSTIEKALADATPHHRPRWQRATTAAILTMTDPTAGHVGSTGTTRRLQALAVMGWPLSEVTARTKIGESSLSVIRSGSHPRCAATAAVRIAAVYDDLSMTPGPSPLSQARARTRGWVSPLAWDDDTIDDPAASPQGAIPPRRRGSVSAWQVEDVEELLTAGHTHAQIAARFGVTPDAILQRLARAGRRDLLPVAWAARRRRGRAA